MEHRNNAIWGAWIVALALLTRLVLDLGLSFGPSTAAKPPLVDPSRRAAGAPTEILLRPAVERDIPLNQ
ncbi:MAG: hypothetical protein HY057_06555 [Rhodospirillales bacterium]|nr:hypothetical protein [Rhodospirillales bacterium]